MVNDNKQIPESIFKPFIKSLYCHSKSEEKMFQNSLIKHKILDEHSKIIPSRKYSNEEKYIFCKDLLIHMKEEESVVYADLKCSSV